ncbi:MAG TPA: glycoside hydrolase family 31 protein [Caulobacteraceae bacterium]
MRTPTFDRPPQFNIAEAGEGRVLLTSDGAAVAHVLVLEEDIVRVLLLPDGALKQPRSFAIAPGQTDIADDGRHRLDTTGFTLPPFAHRLRDGMLELETARVRLTIDLDGFKCRWQVFDLEWKNAAKDRPTQAYDFGWWGGEVRHYLARSEGELYFGLGEKSGAQNRAGRRLRLSNIDALGYNARTSDPLYKHIPLVIARRPAEAISYGLFYDTAADCAFDLGCERDNYHGLYRSFEAAAGDLDYYFIAGPALDHVVRRFTWLTGRPALMPAWALGFSGSSMALADAPDAPAKLRGYLDACANRDLPCASFHLSSGYVESGGRRHVFAWNRDKFSDPAGFAKEFRERGVRLAANVKPALLTDHPLFGEARDLGLLIAEADGTPSLCQFWGGLGAYLDFTHPDTVAWWKDQVKANLLDLGLAATWNDNNEFEIWSPTAMAKGLAAPAREVRALLPLLMMRASRAAQIEHAPGKRPFVVTRSGCAGMQRYAQTWSGDNATSWETLRYNLKMGLGLALSGVSNSGHDVGGFSGPAPDPELLLRWVELGVFMPRFSIHSWNDDGSVNTPWMHETVAGKVAALLRLRARFQPYLRYLSWRYARDFEPIWRPTFYDFPTDPQAWEENDELMLGPSLLVAPVVAPGATRRAVRMPAGADWIDPWTGTRFAGGQMAMLEAPLGRPPMLARVGSVIPVNRAPAHFGGEDFEPGFLVFPADVGEVAIELYDDDGESAMDVASAVPASRIAVVGEGETVTISLSGSIDAPPEAFLLPPGDKRRVIVRRV